MASENDGAAMVTISRLVVGTSGSPGSLQALRYAEGLAHTYDAVLIPVLAWQPPGGEHDEWIPASAELRRTCRDLARQQLRDALLAVWGEVPGDPHVQPRIERGWRPRCWSASPALPVMCWSSAPAAAPV